ncbi:glycosyltransferase family 4 protein [Niastella caeni]|uniref:Glycosyltransferase family 4 protein n=1 Tax=Niastella caeni TaxID=2569763 RepID=A0A4S8HX64_9BACT|nr:glycosyltransferase family 4 protein [Niastella caeni]THU39359.1 glycosyltransferase family 4 protein [Niastella caeni]
MARFLFYDDKLINLMMQDEKPCGGAAVQTYGWIRGLMEEGQEVYVMTDVNGKGVLKEECRNIKLVPMYERNRGVRWLRWLYYRLPYNYKKMKAIKPDYLYVSIPGWTSFLIGIICHLLKIKFIQRISNDNQLDKRFRKDHSVVHQFLLFCGFRLSDHILCQNNFQLLNIKKKFPGKSAIKLFNPLYVNHETPVEGDHSGHYIAWLGIYRRQKNLKLLYQIASLLKKEQFLIAGKEGAHCDEETSFYLEKLKQLPNVKFSGFLHRTEVIPFLANARFLLNTSYYEGFSNTFLEALSVGTPVLSNINVNPDGIISKNNLGIIYNDVFDLCRQHAAITPELHQLMSENAREYVAHNHGYRLLSRRLLRYLSEADVTKARRRKRRLAQLTDQTTQE